MRGSVLLLPFLAGTAGCWAWQPGSLAPSAALTATPEVRVWVRGDTLPRLIGAPVVQGDTVSGLLMGSAPPGQPLLRVALPVRSISHVEVWSYSHRRTMAAIAVPLVAASYAAFLVTF